MPWIKAYVLLKVDRICRFDETIANKVIHLASKIVGEEISKADPVFDEFNANQKRELLSQLLDKVEFLLF